MNHLNPSHKGILDPSIAENFRTKLNESPFVLFYYRDKNGKDSHGCICSSIDWIDVATEYINNYKKSTSDGLNKQTIDIYTYISCIDMIHEAVQQLNRVLNCENKILFKGDNSSFPNKINHLGGKDDNDYFKEIRAHFGAHPTNIKIEHGKLRGYASWPYQGSLTGADYAVSVYSNSSSEKSFTFSIKLEELNNFLLKRYNYLKILSTKIDELYIHFCNNLRKKVIPKDKDPCIQIQHLMEASEERLNRDNYKSTLAFIHLAFQIEPKHQKNIDCLRTYQSFLLSKVIPEIYANLQEMQLDKELSYCPFSPPMEQKLNRPFGKLIEAKESNGKYALEQEEIELYLRDIMDFSSIKDIDERLILTLAGLYMATQHPKP